MSNTDYLLLAAIVLMAPSLSPRVAQRLAVIALIAAVALRILEALGGTS